MQIAAAPTRAVDRIVRAGLLALGLYEIALGLFMVVAPGAFFDLLGPFGAPNDHYVRDNASWELALGAVALVAAGRRSWHVPVLALATIHFALHTLNHLVDVGDADPAWVGVFDLVSLALLTAALAWLLARAARGAPDSPTRRTP